MKIIAVTGTKGKSTVVRLLAQVIHRAGEATLRVDSDGYYINEVQKGTLQDSKDLNKLVATVCPGRYLINMKPYYPDFTAILECSLGCSGGAGLGYRKHNVGIFTNVMGDHIGSSPRLKGKQDVARAKQFIFKRVNLDGYAVFNADDRYVTSQLFVIKPEHKITLLPVGLTSRHFNLESHLNRGGEWVTLEKDWVVVKSKQGSKQIMRADAPAWTFESKYQPSVLNLLFVVAGLYAHFEKRIPAKVIGILADSKLDPYGGRLTLLQNKAGVKIIADYAHEKYSLRRVGKLAKSLATGETIGIVRMAYDRTDKLIAETGKYIGNDFDRFVVYDKVDGYLKIPNITDPRKKFTQKVGYVSRVLTDAIASVNPQVTRVLREDKALEAAARLAKPGDVVVHIVNDDIKRSVGFIKKYFKADFV